jgi:hypothetical protein
MGFPLTLKLRRLKNRPRCEAEAAHSRLGIDLKPTFVLSAAYAMVLILA